MATQTPERRHYGNLHYPKAPGLGLYDRKTAVTFILLVMCAFLASAATASAAVVVSSIGAVLTFGYLTYHRDAHGLTTWDRFNELATHTYRKATGRNVYISDLLTKDTTNLPGLMACTRVTEHDGPLGPFALIHHRNGQVAVVLTCEPTGGSLHDQEAVNLMVGRWGNFGTQFSRGTGVDQYAVTVETGPNFGASAIANVQRHMDPDAPELARQINLDTTRAGAEARATFTTYVSVTFEPLPWAKGTTQEQHDALTAENIGRRIKSLAGGLQDAGAGVTLPATALDLALAARVAYDPGAARFLEDARASGMDIGLEWDQAGPTCAEAHLDSYTHDDHHSVTYKMTNAIRGAYHEDILLQLIDSHPDIDRKRVTQVRHPIPAGVASGKVEADFRDANLSANEKNARGDAELKSKVADATRQEVHLGAGLEKFTTFVTITVEDPDRLKAAMTAIEQELAPATRMDLRIVRGAQDTAFAAALPFGLDLGAYRSESFIARIRRYFL